MSTIKNILFTSGSSVNISSTSQYVLKDDEVLINSALYKKKDLEISIQNLGADDDDDVKVGVRLRDGLKTLPASHNNYKKWVINGSNQLSLSDLVNNINTAIQWL